MCGASRSTPHASFTTRPVPACRARRPAPSHARPIAHRRLNVIDRQTKGKVRRTLAQLDDQFVRAGVDLHPGNIERDSDLTWRYFRVMTLFIRDLLSIPGKREAIKRGKHVLESHPYRHILQHTVLARPVEVIVQLHIHDQLSGIGPQLFGQLRRRICRFCDPIVRCVVPAPRHDVMLIELGDALGVVRRPVVLAAGT